jgi:hypothetical protein
MERKINVSLRVKPLNPQEAQLDKNHLWNCVSATTLMNKRTKEVYQFDNVFGPEISTQQIFDSHVREVVQAAMEGINQTVFAYGQTSSGKTHTMRGSRKTCEGLIPLSVAELFENMTKDSSRSYEVSVQYLELYNETINDLIEPGNKNLEIRESITAGIYINRLSDNKVRNVEEVLEFMDRGDEVRNVAATKLNEHSSRSHTVFRINIKSVEVADEGKKCRVSQLNLVDLAGSEGASKTQAEGLRLREGQNINRSLLALSNVINRLSQSSGSSGRQFVNYRDSKITRILQPALGGNS